MWEDFGRDDPPGVWPLRLLKLDLSDQKADRATQRPFMINRFCWVEFPHLLDPVENLVLKVVLNFNKKSLYRS